MAYPTTVETLSTTHSNGQVIDPAFDNDQARILNAVQAQTVTGGTHSLPDHVTAGDPHSVYQKESERDQANGYLGLGASSLAHPSFLGSGTRDGTKVLGDQGVWVTAAAAANLYPLPGGMTATLAAIDQLAEPPLTLEELIAATSAGGTINLGPYVYRANFVEINAKNLTLNGTAGQTSIRGSEVWGEERWAVQGLQGRPEYWRSLTALPDFQTETEAGAGAVGSTRAIEHPDQVFLNHKSLRRCGRYELPRSGEYGVDEFGHVVLADDPTGTNLVEVTVTDCILQIYNCNVTLNNIDFRHAASLSVGQLAAVRMVWTSGGSNILTATNCRFMHTHGIGLGGPMAPASSVTNCEFAYNGAVGFSPSQTDFVTGMTASKAQSIFAYNAVHHNGHKGYDFIWGAGGTKWAHCTNWWIHNNEFYSNGGVGLWVDIHNTEFIMEYNLIHHNTAMGFCFEISGGLTVLNGANYDVQFRGVTSKFRYNILWENCQADQYTGHPEASGDIFISASENIEVYENLIAWSYRPINVYWNNTRGASQMPTGTVNAPDDILVYRNFVISEMALPNVDASYNAAPLLSFRETGGTALFGATDVGAYDNRYWTRIYANSSSLESNAGASQIWYYNTTAYNSVATLNTTDGGEGPTGGSTSSTWISTTNTLPVPTAVSQVLVGTSALYSSLTGTNLKNFVIANPLPLAPEAGHGYKPAPGMYGPQPPMIIPITASRALYDDERYVLVDCTAGAVVLTLPAPYRRRIPDPIYIKRIDNSGNTVTVAAGDLPGNDTKIDVNNNDVTIAAKGPAGTYAGWLVLLPGGLNWFVMARG